VLPELPWNSSYRIQFRLLIGIVLLACGLILIVMSPVLRKRRLESRIAAA
jgi:hypothetical protein